MGFSAGPSAPSPPCIPARCPLCKSLQAAPSWRRAVFPSSPEMPWSPWAVCWGGAVTHRDLWSVCGFALITGSKFGMWFSFSSHNSCSFVVFWRLWCLNIRCEIGLILITFQENLRTSQTQTRILEQRRNCTVSSASKTSELTAVVPRLGSGSARAGLNPKSAWYATSPSGQEM